jgi:adenosylcobinamide-GDP ribazoletransferase
VNGLRLAASFLTRVPVGAGRATPPADPDAALARAVPWFAVVGAAVGGFAALVYAAAHWLVAPLPAAVLAVTAAVVVTGAFHEDGLADTADALWGGHDVERRLAILKDSRHGTFGVAALVLGLGLRISLVATLAPAAAAGALVAAGALGRGAAVALMATTPTARADGLGASYVRALRRRGAGFGVLAALALGAAALAGWVVAAAAAALGAAWIVRRLAVAKLGGLVGDVLGAAEQVAELAVLVTAAAVVRHDVALGWWPG